MGKRFPPTLGLDVGKSVLVHPYQEEFLKKRRMRFAACCNKIGFCGSDGLFRCPACGQVAGARTAPRVYRWFGLFAGRRGGKTVVGARGALEECLVPGSIGWISGPTEKILHDATMPSFLKRIPREWCKDWDAEHLNLTLTNDALIMFRSLHDPDRAHCGVALDWAWLDEAAFIDGIAWDYLKPALTDHGGCAFFTSSVDGYDWTYDAIEKPAFAGKKYFWAAKWRTIDNPYMYTYRADEIEEAKTTMAPQIFRQEFEGERENFTGAVYGDWIDKTWLKDEEAVKEFIPEWPEIDADRKVIRPLDSGTDHPFGSLAMVVTDRGIVVVDEYLIRERAFSTHLAVLSGKKFTSQTLWCANKNDAAIRMEFAAHGIPVAPAENDVMAGIQRVLSWLYTGQLKIAYTCPKTFEQMKQYRYAENKMQDGQKSTTEKVFKLADELPDCIRYGLMTWPALPKAALVEEINTHGRDEQTQYEIAKLKLMTHGKDDARDLESKDDRYPIGDFWGAGVSEGMFETGGW